MMEPTQTTTFLLVHYNEIGLKGGNRGFFEAKLKENINKALIDVPFGQVRNDYGRLVLTLAKNELLPLVCKRLKNVMGIAHFRVAHWGDPDILVLKDQIAAQLAPLNFSSFKIDTRRADKLFPYNSVQVNQIVGEKIHIGLGKRVDLDNPELVCHIEIFNQKVFYSFERHEGPGGLPVGSGGRVVSLLSSGIDSPVAAFRMMTRGCQVIFVHFHSFPFTEKSSVYNALELVKVLNVYQYRSRIYFVPLAKIQQAIIVNCLPKLRVILYRRMMLRLAAQIARKEKAGALVTGESLGQVASQTLENLAVISQVVSLPILRPLIGMDKDTIVRQAKALGTFKISTEPFADCCSYLVPKSPETKAKVDQVHAAEERIPDLSELLREALDETEEQTADFP
jgi:tRNA uracil 4-sulfurtransferase